MYEQIDISAIAARKRNLMIYPRLFYRIVMAFAVFAYLYGVALFMLTDTLFCVGASTYICFGTKLLLCLAGAIIPITLILLARTYLVATASYDIHLGFGFFTYPFLSAFIAALLSYFIVAILSSEHSIDFMSWIAPIVFAMFVIFEFLWVIHAVAMLMVKRNIKRNTPFGPSSEVVLSKHSKRGSNEPNIFSIRIIPAAGILVSRVAIATLTLLSKGIFVLLGFSNSIGRIRNAIFLAVSVTYIAALTNHISLSLAMATLIIAFSSVIFYLIASAINQVADTKFLTSRYVNSVDSAILFFKRRLASKPTNTAEIDNVPKFLFLRSFRSDSDRLIVDDGTMEENESENLGGWRLETVITSALQNWGDVYALQNPDEKLPQTGARRIKASRNQWRDVVVKHMEDSSLILFYLGATQSLGWELQQAFKKGLREKIILIFPMEAKERGSIFDFCEELARDIGLANREEERVAIDYAAVAYYSNTEGRYRIFRTMADKELIYNDCVKVAASRLLGHS